MLGVKFTAAVRGTVTGVRFYKSAANTGTHVGALWSATGALLASATFTNETASGWEQVNFSKPVEVLAGTTYVASYYAPVGHYADSQWYFYDPPATGGNAFSSAPLKALPANGPPGGAGFSSANGVYSYSTNTFPTKSFAGTNYWVDPVFVPGTLRPQARPRTSAPRPAWTLRV